MDCNYLACQVCLTAFKGVPGYKKHVRSREHQKKMEEVFQKGKFKDRGFFPSIVPMDPVAKQDIKVPIVGLSQLTLCFSTETKDFFYLCHVCEEKCSSDRIAWHFSSGDHCSNYFSYTNPNALNFSWIPSKTVRAILRPELTKEVKERGSGQLQMLDLPENLLKKLETLTYSEVMRTLSENDKLLKLLKALQPIRKMIQTYQRDGNRKHPLLGMQHLVECVCVGPTEERYYLCTLCNLTLATHMIIKHVLSFDHIFCYFREWHPSTLKSKECYLNYSKPFAEMILDFAKQTEEIYGTENTDMKQVSLEPHQFTSVNFTCYAEALKELESITKDKNGSSLITSIKPGKKLESRHGGKGLCGLTPSFKFHCQNCSLILDTIPGFLHHLSTEEHKEKLVRIFSRADGANGYDQKEHQPNLFLYTYIKNSLWHNQPVVGVPLVVTCICTQHKVEPLYVCFACEECFYMSSVSQHFNSRKHLIHTLMYQNPWRLPFAWDCRTDAKVLKSLAWEEERERGPNTVLKIFDIPYWLFWGLTPVYQQVMERLKQQHLRLKSEVPRCETYSKREGGERFPLLGQRFLVQYESVNKDQPTKMAFLCLLCSRRLSDDECHDHVFSREHVEKFLNRFHPGSLNSSADAETLLDLAKQAAVIHSISHVQVIHLDKPIWEPCTYATAKNILAAAKRREGKGSLEPQITPKMKLVPRRKDGQENNQMMEESEKKSSQSSAENSEKALKKISVDAGAEITKTHCGESGGNAEKRADKETPTPSENKPEKMRQVVSETSSKEINTAGSVTCKAIKEEKAEEPTGETCKAIKEEKIEEPITYTYNTVGTEIGEERGKDVLTELKNNMHKENERKRTRSMSENTQNTCPTEVVEKEMDHKRQRLTSKQDASCQEVQNPPDEGEGGKPSIKTAKHEASSGVNDQQTVQLWQYLKRENREPVVGLGALLECCCDERDPVYLCECCALRIPETDIISHVTGADHQKMYLMGSQRLSPPPGKLLDIRHLAAVFEQENGYGEAQVVDLDEDIYKNISQQSFKSAIQTVKALKAQQDSELNPTPALSAVEPMDTSLKDDLKVVDMDVDDEDTSSVHVSTCGTNTSCLLPDARVNDSKAELISNTAGGPSKTAATSKIVGASQYAAASDFAVTSSTTSVTTISKRPASSTSHTTNLTAPISSLRATMSSCTTTNPTTFMLRETPQKCAATTSGATVTATKQTADNLNSSTTSKIENATKKSETSSKIRAASQTVATSSDAPKKIKTSLECGNAEAFAKTACVKSSIRPNADVALDTPKSDTQAAPHLKTLTSQHTNPPTEPSHTSASKTKTSEGPPVVGRNYTIAVTCKEKQQVYCEVCSIRMKQSAHLSSSRHHYNYMKIKYPEWNANPNECQSTLNKAVALLAEAERGLGSRYQKKIEVSLKEYRELADLPDDKAMQRLKEIQRQRSSKVTSSSSTTDNEEVSGQQFAFASPCEVSSPDDGTPQNEMAGLSTDVQSEQEKKHDHQTPMVQIPEIEFASNEDGSLAAVQSDRTQNLKNAEPEANNPISPQLHSCPPLNKNEPEAIAAPSSQLANIMVKVKQETFECELESQATVEITPAAELPAVKMEKPNPLTTHSSTQTHNTYQEMAEKEQKQERSDPDFEDTHEVPKDTQKTSPVKFFNPDPLPSAAAVNTEQQNQSTPIQKVEHVPKHSGCIPEPRKPRTSQTHTVGEGFQKDRSNLSIYLDVNGLADHPIIGWRYVWECRGISRKTFYLCESCSETITLNNICQHMISEDHQLNCIIKWHGRFTWFMQRENLNHCKKMEILKTVTEMLSPRESEKDVQIVMLTDVWHEYIRTATFSEALKMVQKFKADPSLVFLPPSTVQQKDQQPEDRQSREQSPPTERQSTYAIEPHQRDDSDTRQTTDKYHLEETAVAGDLDAVKQIRELSPLDVSRVSPKVDSVVPLLPGAGTCHSLQEGCRSLSMQQELRPLISQHQELFPDLQVKQKEVHSESPSSSIVVSHKSSLTQTFSARDICLPARKRPADISPETLVRPEDPLPAKVQSVSPCSIVLVNHKTNQTWSVSPGDICLPAGKSPADTSPETLVTLGTNKPQLEDPLPAKYAHSSLQPISQTKAESAAESPPVNSAATSAQKDTGSGFEEQDEFSVNYEDLADLLREMKSDTDRQSSMERRLDSKYVQTTCQMDKKQTRWDSKWQPIRAAVKKQPFFTDSLEDTFSTVAPVVSGCENQLIVPNASFSAANAPLEGCSARCNLFSRVTEAKAVDTVLPSVSTTSQSDPQHQRDVTSHNPGAIPLPQGHTETNSTGGCQLPINPIITTRPEPTNKQFMGSHMGQEQTELNRDKLVSHSSPTVATASPCEVPLAASGGYGQYSQRAYATNGHSGYLYSEAVAHCATTDNLPEGYAAWGFSTSQICPEQEANHFGHSLLTPPQSGLVRMEQQLIHQQQQQHLMQQQQLMQQQLMQQQLMQQQQQQLFQQQHLSWASVPTNNSHSYIDLNYQRVTAIQHNNNTMSHNPPQVYIHPLVTHYPPAAQTEIHYLFPRTQGFFKVAPVSHETTP